MSKNVQKISFLLFMLVSVATISCKKKDEGKPIPTVDFSFNPVNPVAPSTVSFTNLSQNATSYVWDFGNGQTSTVQNPSVNYTTGGTFTVTLTATGDGGSNKASKSITITSTPVADFSFTPTNARAPAIITITNTSVSATSYLWDFGNGQTSTLQTPSITYSNGGTYTITLTATGQSGLTNRITKSITVLPAYTRVGITEVAILDYPPTKTNGDNWDSAASGTFPDVYFEITPNAQTTLLYTLPVASRFENLRNSDLPRGWSNTNGSALYTHNSLSQPIDIDLYDYESVGTDEYMGTATFDFRNYISASNPYPSTVTVTNGRISIRLKLAWQ